jgi:hypothetical protein
MWTALRVQKLTTYGLTPYGCQIPFYFSILKTNPDCFFQPKTADCFAILKLSLRSKFKTALQSQTSQTLKTGLISDMVIGTYLNLTDYLPMSN